MSTVTFTKDTEIKGLKGREWQTNFFKKGEALLNCEITEGAITTAQDTNKILWFIYKNEVEITDDNAPHVFKVGDKYREDFDINGMLRAGVSISCSDSYQSLDMLQESLADMNYHREANAATEVLISMENGNEAESYELMTDFNILCAKHLI